MKKYIALYLHFFQIKQFCKKLILICLYLSQIKAFSSLSEPPLATDITPHTLSKICPIHRVFIFNDKHHTHHLSIIQNRNCNSHSQYKDHTYTHIPFHSFSFSLPATYTLKQSSYHIHHQLKTAQHAPIREFLSSSTFTLPLVSVNQLHPLNIYFSQYHPLLCQQNVPHSRSHLKIFSEHIHQTYVPYLSTVIYPQRKPYQHHILPNQEPLLSPLTRLSSPIHIATSHNKKPYVLHIQQPHIPTVDSFPYTQSDSPLIKHSFKKFSYILPSIYSVITHNKNNKLSLTPFSEPSCFSLSFFDIPPLTPQLINKLTPYTPSPSPSPSLFTMSPKTQSVRQQLNINVSSNYTFKNPSLLCISPKIPATLKLSPNKHISPYSNSFKTFIFPYSTIDTHSFAYSISPPHYKLYTHLPQQFPSLDHYYTQKLTLPPIISVNPMYMYIDISQCTSKLTPFSTSNLTPTVNIKNINSETPSQKLPVSVINSHPQPLISHNPHINTIKSNAVPTLNIDCNYFNHLSVKPLPLSPHTKHFSPPIINQTHKISDTTSCLSTSTKIIKDIHNQINSPSYILSYANIDIQPSSLIPPILYSQIYHTPNKFIKTCDIPEELIHQIPESIDLQTVTYFNEYETQIYCSKDHTRPGYQFSITMTPKHSNHIKTPNKHILFVVDGSKTITRERFETFKQGILRSINYLTTEDSFNIIVGTENIQSLNPEPITWAPKNNQFVSHFLNSIKYKGASKNHSLFRLIDQTHKYLSNDRENIVVLMTDQIALNSLESNPHALQNIIQNYQKENCSIHIATIGSNTKNPYLNLLPTLCHGESLHSKTHTAFPRKLAVMIKHLQHMTSKTIHIHPYNHSHPITFYPNQRTAPILYDNKPYTIYGHTTSDDQNFDIILQGRSGNQWIHIKQPISFDMNNPLPKHMKKICNKKYNYSLVEHHINQPSLFE